MPIELGHVEALFRYPVKSMGGERLEVATLGWDGPCSSMQRLPTIARPPRRRPAENSPKKVVDNELPVL